jgi:hypothetical protein
MKNLVLIVISLFMTSMTGCASSAKDVQAQYISPSIYDNYNCQQIGVEMSRLTSEISESAIKVDEQASEDSGTMALGLVIFWPALFFIDGDGPEAQEYGRLKGEYDALEKASIQKECGYEFKELVIPERVASETPADIPL